MVVPVSRPMVVVSCLLNQPSVLTSPHRSGGVPRVRAGVCRVRRRSDPDPTLPAAVLFGHGETVSRGSAVDAFAAGLEAGHARAPGPGAIDPL
ncbi:MULTISPECIES: hypothetical protein [Methylobacterium]|uniref:Uncharacterized protein n=1 Tax=Methylobacterium longum TaxID=767694 RepID=A0ABT8AV04_9HYPH|nr:MULTISPECIES: hypothetical protein [Methylobacterium]MCJ2103317.1 hypothetical protein [Methylobacterium sp. E-046]MDN3573245.1 hypothetical protein [Methylobacterium longum]